MAIDVRRAGDRFHTQIDWLDSWHSFSFSNHYDPANTHHGLLLVNNDDVIHAGRGFGTHSHRDMEIVTWVLDGELEHRDSTGTVGVIYPGLAQRMSAGSGIQHSETNASATADVHLVQMWVPPRHRGDRPRVRAARRERGARRRRARHRRVGRRGARAGSRSTSATPELLAGRLSPGVEVVVPAAPHVHVFVAVGSAALDGAGALAAGDAVRLTDEGPHTLTAGPEGCEVLVWATA